MTYYVTIGQLTGILDSHGLTENDKQHHKDECIAKGRTVLHFRSKEWRAILGTSQFKTAIYSKSLEIVIVD